MNVFPLPLKLCVADPPIDERSAATESPVLLGYRPGVTVTFSVVVWPLPACMDDGIADPTPVGFVVCGASESIGVKARPRNAVLLTAVASEERPPVMGALYPLPSVNVVSDELPVA